MLIDSLGGNLATALSIAAAFKNHGKVSVHFVGMNASAATIASLGAAHISIDKNAMYLVHKCSTALHNQGCGSAMLQQVWHCAHLALDFSPSKHRVGTVFTANNIPPHRNVIVFDDFVTTGQTLVSMQNLLVSLGKNCTFFVGINNKF